MRTFVIRSSVLFVACAGAHAQVVTPPVVAPASQAVVPVVVPGTSSNTIYGVLDIGLTYVNNIGGSRTLQGTSVGVQGSRLGFKGNYAIDKDLSAVYVLEAGFNPENGTLGQGGRIFGRQVFAGMTHQDYGTLYFGRQYDSFVDYVQPVTSNGTVGGAYFSHPYDNDNTDNFVRFNNVLKYRSLAYGPLAFSASHGFSNQAGGTNNNSMTSIGAGYFANGLRIGTGFLQVNNGGLSALNANTTGTATSDQIFVSSRKQTVIGLGASQLFGKYKLGAVATRSKYDGVNESVSKGVGYSFDNFEVNASYYYSDKLTLSAALTHTKGDVTGRGAAFSSPKWNQLSFLADYQFAKGLYLYSEVVYMKAGGSPFAVAGDGGPAAKIPLVGASSTSNQALVRTGFRYNF